MKLCRNWFHIGFILPTNFFWSSVIYHEETSGGKLSYYSFWENRSLNAGEATDIGRVIFYCLSTSLTAPQLWNFTHVTSNDRINIVHIWFSILRPRQRTLGNIWSLSSKFKPASVQFYKLEIIHFGTPTGRIYDTDIYIYLYHGDSKMILKECHIINSND